MPPSDEYKGFECEGEPSNPVDGTCWGQSWAIHIWLLLQTSEFQPPPKSASLKPAWLVTKLSPELDGPPVTIQCNRLGGTTNGLEVSLKGDDNDMISYDLKKSHYFNKNKKNTFLFRSSSIKKGLHLTNSLDRYGGLAQLIRYNVIQCSDAFIWQRDVQLLIIDMEARHILHQRKRLLSTQGPTPLSSDHPSYLTFTLSHQYVKKVFDLGQRKFFTTYWAESFPTFKHCLVFFYSFRSERKRFWCFLFSSFIKLFIFKIAKPVLCINLRWWISINMESTKKSKTLKDQNYDISKINKIIETIFCFIPDDQVTVPNRFIRIGRDGSISYSQVSLNLNLWHSSSSSSPHVSYIENPYLKKIFLPASDSYNTV